jgi:hypothetical protein
MIRRKARAVPFDHADVGFLDVPDQARRIE